MFVALLGVSAPSIIIYKEFIFKVTTKYLTYVVVKSAATIKEEIIINLAKKYKKIKNCTILRM